MDDIVVVIFVPASETRMISYYSHSSCDCIVDPSRGVLPHFGVFSPVSSNNQTYRHDIAEMLLIKAALSTRSLTVISGTAYSSEVAEFTRVLSGVHAAQSLVFYVVLCRPLFIFLFLVINCLSFTSDYSFCIFKLFHTEQL
jgi:hypothetical protein